MNSLKTGILDFEVRLYDSGPDGKARIRTLFNFMQSTADNHSMSLGTSMNFMAEKNLTWVYSRFFAEIFRYPLMYEKVRCETWRSGVTGGMVNREFIMTDLDGAEILRATSSLALIDRNSRKPVDIPDSIINQFEPARGRALNYNTAKIEKYENFDYTYTMTTRYEDMDVNNHMNNASYAQMFFESCYSSMEKGMVLGSIDIMFKGEIHYNERINCGVLKIDSKTGEVYHSAFNANRGRVSAVALTKWN